MAKEKTFEKREHDFVDRRKQALSRDEEELNELLRQRNEANGVTQEESSDENSENDVQVDDRDSDLGNSVSEDAVEETVEQNSGEVEENIEEPGDDEEKTWKKRYSDLRRHQNELTTKIKELEAKLDNTSEEDVSVAPPETEQELAQWLQQYPDTASMLDKFFERKFSEKTAKERAEQEKINRQKQVEEAKAKLLEAHPDFYDLVSDTKFHDFVKTRTVYQDAIYKNNTDWQSASDVIQIYKDKTLKPKKNPSSTAHSVKTKGKVEEVNRRPENDIILESQIQKMSEQEFMNNLKKIDKARKEGRYRNDLLKAV